MCFNPYWDVDPETEDISHLDYPAIGDYFYVARGRSVFVGLASSRSAAGAETDRPDSRRNCRIDSRVRL